MAVHQPDHRVERAVGLPPRLGQRPQPGEIDMGVTGQCQRAVLRIAPAQPFQRGNQGVARRRNGFPLATVEACRRSGKVLRQLPDRLLFARRGDAGDVVGVFPWAIQAAANASSPAESSGGTASWSPRTSAVSISCWR